MKDIVNSISRDNVYCKCSSDAIIRLVSTEKGAPVLNPFCDQFHPLEIFDVEIVKPCPRLCQTENVLVDFKKTHFRNEKYNDGIKGILNKTKTIKCADSSFMLDGSYKLNDITPFLHSLEIIEVTNLNIYVEIFDGKRRGKCDFNHNGKRYRFMRITDPDYADTTQFFDRAILAVSIPTDKWKESGYFKFVAAIYPDHPWTKEEDEELLYEKKKNWDISIMAMVHERTEKEIQSRLDYLETLIS